VAVVVSKVPVISPYEITDLSILHQLSPAASVE
jgi:hypothetical protein